MRVANFSLDNSRRARSAQATNVQIEASRVLAVYFHRILVPERRLTDEKLVDKDAKSPPVDRRAMTRVLDHFRC